jgi:hypothetical protein
MAFRLRLSDGLTIEVDSLDELRAAISIFRPTPLPQAPQPLNLPLEADLLRQFVRQLRGHPRQVVLHLGRAEGVVRDDELRTVLGFQTNYQLAGTMGGLSKRAVRLGIAFDQVITREVHQNGAGRHYTYRLTDGMRAVIAS